MKKLTYDSLVRHPELLDEIDKAARRERAIAIQELVARLFGAFARKEPRRAVGPRLAH